MKFEGDELQYYHSIGIQNSDIELIERHRCGKTNYNDSKSALAMVERLRDCQNRYGINWTILPDVELLIWAGLKEDAIELYRLEKRAQRCADKYRQELLFPKAAQEAISSNASKAGSSSRRTRPYMPLLVSYNKKFPGESLKSILKTMENDRVVEREGDGSYSFIDLSELCRSVKYTTIQRAWTELKHKSKEKS